MPNFWTSTSQKIYEVLYGPRTRDVEFDEKVDELTQTLHAVRKVQEIIHSFHSRTEGIPKLSAELYTNLPVVYSKDVIYYEFIKDVCTAHKSLESSYLSCVETIDLLTQSSNEWNKLHNEVNANLQVREENRQVYDHYDEKMEKLVRNRNDKLARHHNETPKEVEKFERNDGKYKRAANDLIQSSNYTYKLIQDLLDYRYRLLNPLVASFVTQEKKFIDSCAEFFRKFDNLAAKMSGLDIAFKPTKITYDPTKHIRATRLLVGVNINELPQIIRKEKYGYEDYLKRKEDRGGFNGNGGGNGNIAEYHKIMNMDKGGITNPFSYEAYKAKTNLNPNTVNKDQSQTPFNIDVNSNNNIGGQSNQEYIPKQQWDIKMKGSDNEQKNSEDINVYNPYSNISLNSPNPILNPMPMPMNNSNANPPSAFQTFYQSQMPMHSNSNNITQMSSQLGNNSNDYMRYSNIPRRPNNTFNLPDEFPK